MNRSRFVFAVLVALALALTRPVSAQMGMDIFQRPAITKVFHPVVGKGAVYVNAAKDGKMTRTNEISIVGNDSFEGKVSGCRFIPAIPRAKSSSARA
jgi:hypothetical protein